MMNNNVFEHVVIDELSSDAYEALMESLRGPSMACNAPGGSDAYEALDELPF